MDKFLSIPVSGASNALVSVADVLSITRTSEAMIKALATSWTDVVYPYAFSKDISGIVIA